MYTIDVNNINPSNYANPGYVPTEGATKNPNDNSTYDNPPSYEEAIRQANTKPPIAPTPPVATVSYPTLEVVNEENVTSSRGGRRHRHHRRHRNRSSEQSNENAQPEASEEHRRHRHRRGFRLKRHLAKMNRRNQDETD